jgi:hypothetical protein
MEAALIHLDRQPPDAGGFALPVPGGSAAPADAVAFARLVAKPAWLVIAEESQRDAAEAAVRQARAAGMKLDFAVVRGSQHGERLSAELTATGSAARHVAVIGGGELAEFAERVFAGTPVIAAGTEAAVDVLLKTPRCC